MIAMPLKKRRQVASFARRLVWFGWIGYGGKEVVFLRHELRVSFGLVTFVGVEPFFQKQGYVSK